MSARARHQPWFQAPEEERRAVAEGFALRNRGAAETWPARIWNADPVDIRIAWYPDPRRMREFTPVALA